MKSFEGDRQDDQSVQLTPDEERSLRIYAAANGPQRPVWFSLLLAVWTVAGVTLLTALALFEPFSRSLFDWLGGLGTPAWVLDFVLLPLALLARAALLVEVIGYAYHRFAQHVGRLTRCFAVIRRNQRMHWNHHMIIYPYGPEYERDRDYVPSEKGNVGSSWMIPTVLLPVVAALVFGITLQAVVFIVGMALHSILLLNILHPRFHESKTGWRRWGYFRWIAEIHLLHHYDQRCNYTIAFPLMDVLFGTYLAPSRHKREIEECLNQRGLTVSDMVNWMILLEEAHPEEFAAIVSAAKTHRASRRNLEEIARVLGHCATHQPDDEKAARLSRRAARLVMIVTSQ